MKQADEILKDLKQGKYAPVYFLQGDEPYYIDRISGFIENHVLSEGERSFNQTIVYGNDVNISDILNHARRFPMMAEYQVVIVKEAQQIHDLNREEGELQLSRYLENPVPSTLLVFCHKNKSLDGRKALGKLMRKKAVFLETKALYDNQIPAWVNQYVRERGFSIGNAACMMLTESIGNNLERLSNEVDKILINYKDPVEITPDMIDKYVGISKDYNPWELSNAILRKDIQKTFRIVDHFAANSRQNPAIPVIAVLYGQFSKLLVAAGQLRSGKPVELSALKVNGYYTKDYANAARHYTVQDVTRSLHHIRIADLRCKGVDSQSDEGEVLRELVSKIVYGLP